MNTTREARRDAEEYARSAMGYGEGAGIRRRLIAATVESKSYRDPAYERAFAEALEEQDMGKHAQKARSERRRKDVAYSIKRNTKAVVSGDYKNLTGPVLVVVALGWAAHETGYDRKLLIQGQELVRKARLRYQMYKIRRDVKKHSNQQKDPS